MGNPEEGVRREFAALGLDFAIAPRSSRRGSAVLNELFRTGATSFKGKHYNYDDVAFYSGTEMAPLQPVQKPPPIWVVSQPAAGRRQADREDARRSWSAPAVGSSSYGDGWMTCCRAQHPEELTEQIGYLRDASPTGRARLRGLYGRPTRSR